MLKLGLNLVFFIVELFYELVCLLNELVLGLDLLLESLYEAALVCGLVQDRILARNHLLLLESCGQLLLLLFKFLLQKLHFLGQLGHLAREARLALLQCLIGRI